MMRTSPACHICTSAGLRPAGDAVGAGALAESVPDDTVVAVAVALPARGVRGRTPNVITAPSSDHCGVRDSAMRAPAGKPSVLYGSSTIRLAAVVLTLVHASSTCAVSRNIESGLARSTATSRALSRQARPL